MSPNQYAHEIHTVTALVATSFPSSSSVDNINSSPTSLSPESPSFHGVSTFPSSPSTLTVKFAPLPQINPNRKRSLAPLGVPARSRRIPVVEQDSGSLLWSRDLDVPENMEDPLVAFARFIKKTSRTLWRRVRKGSLKTGTRDDEGCPTEPVLDIRSTEGVQVGVRPASWSPSAECGMLGRREPEEKRRSTSDLRSDSLSVVP